MHQRLLQIATTLDYSLTDSALQALVQWLDLLQSWNRRIDLTAARSLDELADLALADALVLAKLIGREERVVDVGTGAGAPGLALALVRPDLSLTLVEPATKRVSFLRTVLGSTRCPAKVLRERGERVASRVETSGEKWGWAISRATLEPSQWLKLGSRLVGGPGTVALLIAREAPVQLEGATLVDRVEYRWPLTDVPRTACTYRLCAGLEAEVRAGDRAKD